VRHLGPALLFPVAGGLVAGAILGGLTQWEFREFGARTGGGTGEADASARVAETSARG
jgi:hypothetical protein